MIHGWWLTLIPKVGCWFFKYVCGSLVTLWLAYAVGLVSKTLGALGRALGGAQLNICSGTQLNICSVSEGNTKRFLSDCLYSFMWRSVLPMYSFYTCYYLLLVRESELSTHPWPQDMDIEELHRCAVLHHSTLQMTQQLSNQIHVLGEKEQVVIPIGYLHWLQ